MAPTEQLNLVPDETILFEIFSVTIKLTSCHIISNTFNTCTFSIHDVTPLPDHPNIIVRLETSQGRLAAIAAFQTLCHTSQLTDLVPPVLSVGTVTTTDKRQVEYSVSPYYTGTTSLEDVWDTLDDTNQLELVNSVVYGIEKLQKLDISNIYRGLGGTPYFPDHINSQPGKRFIGGPDLGYYQDIKQFLGKIIQTGNQILPTCELLDLDNGIAINSIYNDIGRVELSYSDLDNLLHYVVCCHNDLEPRNILVKEVFPTEAKGVRYKLAAIVDWDMVGFYPFAYEYGGKDTILGISNLSFSWYTLFKERTSHLLPRDECHTKFIKALWIINESKRRRMTRNVGVRFQAKWIEREEVEISPDLRQGWIRKSDAKAPKAFSKDDREIMEQEILRELGYV